MPKIGRLVFRAWYYFRIGYGTYVAFPLGFASTMVIIYELALKGLPEISFFFPHLYIFGIVAFLVLVPISIYAGLYHLRRTGAYPAEVSITTESNPYMYRAIPGKETEVYLPASILGMEAGMDTLEALGKLTPELRTRFEKRIQQLNDLREGKEFR